MAFLKSRRGAVVVTVLVILFSVVFGAHRSLTSLRSDALEVFETGAYGDGHSVKGDLEARRATCANLYTVASRYLWICKRGAQRRKSGDSVDTVCGEASRSPTRIIHRGPQLL